MATPNFRHDVWEDFRAISTRKQNGLILFVCLFTRAGFLAAFLYRVGAFCTRKGSAHFKVLTSFFWRLNILINSCDISPYAVIAGGLKLPHPFGIVIGHARIGKNVMIMQNATLGMRHFHADEKDPASYPILGDGVIICAGAQVLGGVVIHDGAMVGANAVVTQDVPAGQTAIGIPARCK